MKKLFLLILVVSTVGVSASGIVTTPSNNMSPVENDEWHIEILDGMGFPGFGSILTSITVDNNNKVYISYGSYKLKYINNSLGSWEISNIDQNASLYGNSITTDKDNNIHIGYLTSNSLNYATNANGSWEIEIIDQSVETDSDYCDGCSIAVDNHNKVHMSYYDASDTALKYATKSDGEWEIYTIDNSGDVGGYNSIAVDYGNKVHISYYDDTNWSLKYASNSSGSWKTQFIDYYIAGGEYNSIAIDSNNYVHISYDDFCRVGYATNSSGSWRNYVIGGAGKHGITTSIEKSYVRTKWRLEDVQAPWVDR